MALAIDGSSPGVATQTGGSTATVTTASFTPPSNSLLLIGWAGNTGSATDPGASPTITDNLGVHLTYTQIAWKHRGDAAPSVDGQASMWWAKVGTSAAMTVTVTTGTGAGAQQAAIKVWVVTGQDTTTPIGASGKSGSTAASSIAQSYTAQATGGQGFIAVCDWAEVGAETAGTGCTSDGSANILTDITYGFMRRTSADDSNGVSNTLNVTLPGTSNNLNWVYAEVKPASSGTTNGTATVTGAGTLAANVTQQASTSPTGAGSLAATVTQQSGSSLTGAGNLSASVTQQATATLTGAGTLTSPVVQGATATLTGAGTVTAAGTGSGSNSAFLTGAGVLSAKATQGTSAALTGAGTLSATATQGSGTTLTGAGTLSAAGVIAGSATLTGAGTLTSPVRQLAGANLVGAGTLTASAGGTVSGTAVLVGAGVLTAGIVGLPGSMTLTTTGGRLSPATASAHLVSTTSGGEA